MSAPIARLKSLFSTRQKADSRYVHFNKGGATGDETFCGNTIATTKYTWLTFLPKGLYEQFRRSANLYFLFHCCISVTPVSPVSPITTVTPLSIVIGISMFKELLEDRQRGLSDKEANAQTVTVLVDGETGGDTRTVQWREIRVGDIVRVEADQFFPADLVCLGSSSSDGTCFVETANLDGETNLKQRKALEETCHLPAANLTHLRGRIECEQPNVSIYTFAGNLLGVDGFQAGLQEGERNKDGEVVTNLFPSNLLLRGSRLRNTPFVYGLVIFTGPDTKVMMNSLPPPSKRSVLEKQLDWLVLFQILALFVLATFTAVAYGISLATHFPAQWYLRPDNIWDKNAIERAQFDPAHPALAAFLNFLTALVLYGYFVPLALYVSIEVIRSIQAHFIAADCHMFDDEDEVGAKALTSNLNEELGMVSTVLSDKTGTLTRNQMDFFKCSIGGVKYGQGSTQLQREAAAAAAAGGPNRNASSAPEEDSIESESGPLEPGFNMRDPNLDGDKWRTLPNADVIRRFVEVLAVCHTVVTEGGGGGEVKYLAESPDETAFVVAAKRLGMAFLRREGGDVVVLESGKGERRYQLLNTLTFTASRKRMSVVVKSPEGDLLLFCKGADSVMMERLDPSVDGQKWVEGTEEHLMEYAVDGLRTMVVSWKPIQGNEYEAWQTRWTSARGDVHSASDQSEKLALLAEEIETGLMLLGGSAIEDKLQVGVPQTIASLAAAGVKLWVLTGDKVETAVNIGYACNLLTHSMTKHVISMGDVATAQREADAAGVSLKKFCFTRVKDQVEKSHREARSSSPSPRMALIIDGMCLDTVLEDPPLTLTFLELSLECASVLCCRVSPRQKALVTALVRHQGRQVCLSIGDGANDVGMIQKANVGVGNCGEGGAAGSHGGGFLHWTVSVLGSFAVGARGVVLPKALTHGRMGAGGWGLGGRGWGAGGWGDRVSAELLCSVVGRSQIKYFLYKNFAYGFTTFFFNCCAQYSGSTLYVTWYLSLYSVFFTAIPICVVACTDQDVNADLRMRFPPLHEQGRRNRYFNVLHVGTWMLNGIYQAAVAFLFVLGAYWVTSDRSDGKILDMQTQGTTMATMIILAVNLQLAQAIQYFTWIHHLTFLATIGSWFIFLLVLDAIPPNAPVILILIPSFSFYLILLCGIVVMLMPDFVGRAIQRRLFPSDLQILQEIEHKERGRRMRVTSHGGLGGVEMRNYHTP